MSRVNRVEFNTMVKYCAGTLILALSAVVQASTIVQNIADDKHVLLGGPTDIRQSVVNNDRAKEPAFVLPHFDDAITPWLEWRRQLADEWDFRIGTDYQLLTQWADDSLGETQAAGGVFRFFGDWTILGKGTDHPGSIVFKAEHRHRIGSGVAPEQLGGELGYVGIVGTGYGDFGLGVTDTYWKQQFLGKRPVELRLGRLAPTAYLDGTLTSDPYATFMNFSLMYTPTIAYPADGSLGAALWVGLADKLYVLGTLLDANSSTTSSGLNSIDEGEFFTAIEFGWADRGAASSFVDNIHMTAWHSDKRTKLGVPESKGVGLTASWLFGNDRWGPFMRLGWSDGGAALMERSIAGGVAMNFTERSDLIGIGINRGEPFSVGSKTQYSTELFYRWQLAQNLAITPDVQYIQNPALNPDDSSILVWGLRFRLSL